MLLLLVVVKVMIIIILNVFIYFLMFHFFCCMRVCVSETDKSIWDQGLFGKSICMREVWLWAVMWTLLAIWSLERRIDKISQWSIAQFWHDMYCKSRAPSSRSSAAAANLNHVQWFQQGGCLLKVPAPRYPPGEFFFFSLDVLSFRNLINDSKLTSHSVRHQVDP